MTVLAIDTSARRRVVCVLAEAPTGDLVRAVVEEDVDIDRSLPPAVQSLLSDSISEVAVVTGPGSYTGVRAGMAAALGIAHARRLPLHGVTSLVLPWAAALAAGAEEGWVLADAGRGAIYAMPFRGGGASSWSRVELAAFDGEGRTLYSCDPLPIDDLRRVDPAAGLALAVPFALRRRLELTDLQAEYGAP